MYHLDKALKRDFLITVLSDSITVLTNYPILDFRKYHNQYQFQTIISHNAVCLEANGSLHSIQNLNSTST